MKRPFNPDEEILRYCEHICNAHKQTRRLNNNSKTWYRNYPAMAAICHDHGCNVKRASYSHFPRKDEFNPVLKSKLQELGDIGTHSLKEKKFVIGNCAEQHAANIYMKQLNENDMSQLYFSKPMRPRTKQTFDYCDNCKDTFPNL